MCYETGPNGFALMRRLEAMGPVVVEVVAPSLTPRRSGQRVKTDPMDAKKLVHLYRAGELHAIVIPDEDSESARDLVRTYHRVGEETTRKKHHILKFLTRRGQPAWAIAIAERAHHRLHKRYWALLLRGLPAAKVTTVVARELVSFVWEAMTEARHQSRKQVA
jgi:hypothetical protein